MYVYVVTKVTNDAGWLLSDVEGIFKTLTSAKHYVKEHIYDCDEETSYEIESFELKD